MEKLDKGIKKQADRGWQLMAETLDREMPQAGKKRRPLWPWGVALGGAAVALGGVFLFEKSGEAGGGGGQLPAQKMEAKNTAGQPVAETQTVDNQSFEKKIASGQPVGQAVAAPPFSEKKGVAEKAGAASPFDKKQTREARGDDSFPQKNQGKKGGTASDGLPQNMTEKAAAPAKGTAQNLHEKLDKNRSADGGLPVEKTTGALLTQAPEPTGQPKIFEKKQSVELLPGRKARPVLFEKKSNGPPVKTTIPVASRRLRKTHLGLAASVQTIGFQRFNGHALGLAASRSLSPRTSLQAGLQWSRTVLGPQPVTNFALAVLVPQDEYLAETNDIALEFTDPSKSVIDLPTGIPSTGTWPYTNVQLAVSANVLHRLEMPLVLTQKVGVRWHFGAGFSPSWQFMARSVTGAGTFRREKTGEFENLGTGSNIIQADAGISSSRQVNRLLTRSLPAFDVAAVASAGFDISGRWRAAAQFQQGLFDQSALPNHRQQLRSARLSLTYWLF